LHEVKEVRRSSAILTSILLGVTFRESREGTDAKETLSPGQSEKLARIAMQLV
jgi:hypothetical protein